MLRLSLLVEKLDSVIKELGAVGISAEQSTTETNHNQSLDQPGLFLQGDLRGQERNQGIKGLDEQECQGSCRCSDWSISSAGASHYF